MEGARLTEFDVVVFGATGVTGRQVAAYCRAGGTEARWAAAGRDPAKLERTLGEVGATPTETIAAELGDPDSLAAMAARAKVVLNLVGPYTPHARPVIAACVAGGAHYADLTGEIPFVREMVEEFDLAATEAGVKIIQVCGFEALPPDLAVLWAAEIGPRALGRGARRGRRSGCDPADPPGLPRPSDMISGGTFQSMAEMVGHRDPEAIADPAALIADPALADAIRARSPIALTPAAVRAAPSIGPMAPAAFINPAVIQRTAALAAAERGVTLQPFRYREGVALGGSPLTLPFRLGAAGALAGTQVGIRALSRARRRSATASASALRRRSFPRASARRPTASRPGMAHSTSMRRTTGAHELAVEVEADGHPGYLATARMLGEAGLMLATDGETPERAGCLTPAMAIGTGGLKRFERAQMWFSVA